jgi:hypothetical protein
LYIKYCDIFGRPGVCGLGGIDLFDSYRHLGTFCEDGTYSLPVDHQLKMQSNIISFIPYGIAAHTHVIFTAELTMSAHKGFINAEPADYACDPCLWFDSFHGGVHGATLYDHYSMHSYNGVPVEHFWFHSYNRKTFLQYNLLQHINGYTQVTITQMGSNKVHGTYKVIGMDQDYINTSCSVSLYYNYIKTKTQDIEMFKSANKTIRYEVIIWQQTDSPFEYKVCIRCLNNVHSMLHITVTPLSQQCPQTSTLPYVHQEPLPQVPSNNEPVARQTFLLYGPCGMALY